jgi:hypothetical protein
MRRSIHFASAILVTILATTGCAAESGDPASEGSSESSTGEALTDSKLSADATQKAKKILSDKIPSYYEGDGHTFGVVTQHGSPALSATSDPNVVHATGTFEDNELWGGAFLYSYDVDVNLTARLIKQLKKPVMIKEIN